MPPTTLAGPLGATKIFLDSKDVDMRKSFDGLHAIVQQEFERDVRAGDLFLFLNRRLDRIKLLHWDGDGLGARCFTRVVFELKPRRYESVGRSATEDGRAPSPWRDWGVRGGLLRRRSTDTRGVSIGAP